MKYRLVPVEPTPAMVLCLNIDMVQGFDSYALMLRNAPQPEPLSDARITKILNLTFAASGGTLIQFARAIEHEIISGGQAA